jgi:hypothetical protein
MSFVRFFGKVFSQIPKTKFHHKNLHIFCTGGRADTGGGIA